MENRRLLTLSRLCEDDDKLSIWRALASIGVSVALFAAMVFSAVPAARAQTAGLLSSSYITPFPQTDRYQVRIIGDWLGPGVADALKEAFKQEHSLEISDISRSNYGLVRAGETDLYGEIGRMIAGPPIHIAVIMLGVNDRASMKAGAGRAQPGSAEWKDTYEKEAEKLIKKLKAANIAVYWLGLPVMGNPAFSENVAQMNDAVRQAAYVNGIKFIETWAGFTDQLGAYSAYGPDLTGQTKRLRDGDGIGFTAAGYRKFASYVETALRRDLTYAKAQRNIPLAGDEEEQARVVPNASHNVSAKASGAPAAETESGKTGGAAGASASSGDPADSKTQAANEPGPPPESQKRDSAAFGSGGGYQGGEFILGDLGDGLTAIAVISPGDFSMREILRQTPLADRLYYKALSKGEALTPKDGRADDFRWQGGSATAQAQ